jgi:RNA polymerase sigma-70 factor, ECF subfamily
VTPHDEVRAVLAEVHRREWARVLATTVRLAGDLDLGEECAQDAFVAALQTWPRDGIPRSPGAWLTTAARRKVLDAHRRAGALRGKLPLLLEPYAEQDLAADARLTDMDEIPDDRLRLVFTCCHPALAREAQVGLTLRLVCGLSTAEVAHAFLVSEPTMAARVTRAKKKISGAGIPYRVPAAHELPDRLDAVLTVVHLVFTTGHTAPTGDRLTRPDLVDRAVDLARVLAELMPDEREARGLLALLLLTDARRTTRVDEAGRLVLLQDQDRSRWDRDLIEQGRALVLDALRGGRPGRFVLQAAIAALHAEAPTWAETDWCQIVQLYDVLLLAWPSPVVALNRAAALSFRDGPAAGLAALDALDQDALATSHYLPAARADLLRRLDRTGEAAASYRLALDLVDNEVERSFLQGRLEALSTPPVASGTVGPGAGNGLTPGGHRS